MSKSPRKFVWYELLTTDPAAAESFYRNVIGWGTQDSGVPGMSYTILSAGAIPIGGLMALPEAALAAGARPGWIGYVDVEDVDASAAEFAKTGGGVHHAAADIPGVGRFAVVADPQGAALALFKNACGQEPAPVPPGAPGHAGWRELHAADGATAFAFYADRFGWTKGEAFDMGPLGVYQLFKAGGDEAIGGITTKAEAIPHPFWLYYFNVENIDAAAGRVGAARGQILMGPHEVPGGDFILQGLDPQGAMFALVGPRG
jgi:predicted enzyme related to lactoylglutathione lyase